MWSRHLKERKVDYTNEGRDYHEKGSCLSLAAFYLCSLKGRGGQSALRFARLRMEKRHNYVRKVAETAVQLFISGDKVNVAGLVLAGSADFKTELSQSDMFDQVNGSDHVLVVSGCISIVCLILLLLPGGAVWCRTHSLELGLPDKAGTQVSQFLVTTKT